MLQKILIFVTALIFSTSAWAIAPTDSNVITIAADSWCPINCAPPEERLGVGVDLAKAIFEPQGYRVDYQIIPWTEALEKVRRGEVDAVIGASRYDDASLVFPEQPIYRITDDFYVLKGSPWRFEDIHSLKSKRLGIIADYGYSEQVSGYIREHRDQLDAVQIATGTYPLQTNIKKLLNQQIDVIVETRPVMEYTLMKMQLRDKISWAGSLPQAEVFLAFSPALSKSKGLAEQFDHGIEQLAASGKLGSYYRDYGLSEAVRR